MVKYTFLLRGVVERECEWTPDQARRSIGWRVELGFDVVSRFYRDRSDNLVTVVYFVDLEGHVWAIYDFSEV